jgi:hypothetical protein
MKVVVVDVVENLLCLKALCQVTVLSVFKESV